MYKAVKTFLTIGILITVTGCFSTVYTENPATGKTVKTVYWGSEHGDRKVLYQTQLPESRDNSHRPFPPQQEYQYPVR